MRILFVAMPDSIHTARWLAQLQGQGWEIALFPPYRAVPHPLIRQIKYFGSDPYRPIGLDKSVNLIRWASFAFYMDDVLSQLQGEKVNLYKEKALVRAIHSFEPNIVHSLEIQNAGYLTLAAREKMSKEFPAWVVTNWGSDLYLFGRLTDHREHVRRVLEKCDFYSCECKRDVVLAQEMGLRGRVLPVVPNSGGFDIDHIQSLRQLGLTSQRRIILLKGYQHWAGRALVGLRALARSADVLRDGGYRVAISMASPDVRVAAELFQQETGIPIEIIPNVSHEEMLRWYGKARVYIGLSISDAISTSFLEAIVMGAFPIQSCTACVDEWITDGKSGLIVPPEDPEVIEKAIRRTILDDSLVNQAAEINSRVARERLDVSVIQPQVLKMYEDIISEV